MRAAVLTNPGVFEFTRSYPEPRLSPTDIKLKVAFSGICGSDLHLFVMKEAPIKLPQVLGHEFCGEVVEVGSGVTSFKIGDKAVGIIDPSCGTCDLCRQGDFTLCERKAMFERSGSFADLIVAPANQMFAVPPETPDDEGAVIEPVSVAVHAIRRSRLALGENVVVLGGGPLGLLIMMLARQAGADKVILVEPAPSRRKLAAQLGADMALEPGPAVEDAVSKATVGKGAEVVFEVSGNVGAFAQAGNLLRKQGRLVLVAAFEVETLPLSPFTTLIKELEVIATFWANALDFQRAIKLVASRKLDVRPLISARVGLEDAQRAFDGLVKDKNSQIKVLFSNL